jgi:hypothetical protein
MAYKAAADRCNERLRSVDTQIQLRNIQESLDLSRLRDVRGLPLDSRLSARLCLFSSSRKACLPFQSFALIVYFLILLSCFQAINVVAEDRTVVKRGTVTLLTIANRRVVKSKLVRSHCYGSPFAV